MPLRTTAAWRVLDGFGGSVRSLARSVSPESVEEMAAAFATARAEGLTVSFRGAGRSYGDASLNAGQLSVDGRAMRRILSFDAETGVVEAQGGVSIAEVWRHTLPHGWWPAVVPGTMFPTMGGCVGMNIHGKNCFKVGSPLRGEAAEGVGARRSNLGSGGNFSGSAPVEALSL